MGMRRAPYALTERGLYMLATILKGEGATRATLAIVNTYAQVRSMVRDTKKHEFQVRMRGEWRRARRARPTSGWPEW